jgi:hypothetical protein
MNAEPWISCKKQMPEDGDTVLTKTRAGVIREAIWVTMGGVSGWMINVTGPKWRRSPGSPIWWQKYEQPKIGLTTPAHPTRAITEE